MSELSVIIPTHERQEKVTDLAANLCSSYSFVHVVIIDTSKTINEILKNNSNSNLRYFYLSENQGISFSRNLGINVVDTDYVLFMDDDFQLSEKTRLDHFLPAFKNSRLDILGGEINNIDSDNYDFHGTYEVTNSTLYHFVGLSNNETGNTFDVIYNYFLARTERILDIGGWDKNLKFAREHDDFFLNAKKYAINVGYDDNYGVDHYHNGKKFYEEYEKDNKNNSIRYFCDKFGIKSKIEIRLLSNKEGNPYLSIYRFMGDDHIELTEDELTYIYSKYGFMLGQLPYVYKHIY